MRNKRIKKVRRAIQKNFSNFYDKLLLLSFKERFGFCVDLLFKRKNKIDVKNQ